MLNNQTAKAALTKKYGAKIAWDEANEQTFTVEARALTDVMAYLKGEGYDFLSDITSIDYKDKYVVVYQLFQFGDSGHFTARVELDHEKPEVDSLCRLWDAANWLEREVYDMMGIRFKFHPNLKRILMWEEFEGYPLRKDFVHKPNKYQGRREMK